MSRRFTEAEIAEVWERRKAGGLTRSIARRLGRNGSSIRRLFENAGGVRPAPRRRAERHLTLLEREEISRGVAGCRGRHCGVGSGFQVLEHSGHMLAVSAAGDQPPVLGVAFVIFHRREREEDGAMHVGGRCRCDHRSCSEARLNNASGVAMNVG